jgi:hypothetical protein
MGRGGSPNEPGVTDGKHTMMTSGVPMLGAPLSPVWLPPSLSLRRVDRGVGVSQRRENLDPPVRVRTHPWFCRQNAKGAETQVGRTLPLQFF